MTFSELSNEAKLLLIIGEPLRNDPRLTWDVWTKRIWVQWTITTGKGWDDFKLAFGEIAMLMSKKKTAASPELASAAAITTNGEGGLQ